MRYTFLLAITIFLVSFQAKAQMADSAAQKPASGTYDYYMLKSKNQKTAGFILTGGGLLLGAIGATISVGEALQGLGGSSKKETNAGPALMGIGTVLVGTGVTFFILSGSNKQKAKLLVKGQSINLPNGNSTQLAFGIRVSL